MPTAPRRRPGCLLLCRFAPFSAWLTSLLSEALWTRINILITSPCSLQVPWQTGGWLVSLKEAEASVENQSAWVD